MLKFSQGQAIKASKASIATIISTHLQHSEIPKNPEAEDVRARAVMKMRWMLF
jgi:hypothetical protein